MNEQPSIDELIEMAREFRQANNAAAAALVACPDGEICMRFYPVSVRHARIWAENLVRNNAGIAVISTRTWAEKRTSEEYWQAVE